MQAWMQPEDGKHSQDKLQHSKLSQYTVPSRKCMQLSWQRPSWRLLSQLSGLTLIPFVAWPPVIKKSAQCEILPGCCQVHVKRGTVVMITYRADSHPDCQVAKNDDTQGNKATCYHKCNHKGLGSQVIPSTEHIWTTWSLQPMRPVPDAKIRRLTRLVPDHFET